MAMMDEADRKPLGLKQLAVVWLVMTAVATPLWVWQDGKYGVVKAAFFALFFAGVFRLKRDFLDVAVFAFIMTGLHIFSRYVVNYHQLVVDANPAMLAPLALHALLTLGAAWLTSWLFDLRRTPGPTYSRLAAFYMIFYFAEFILHALAIMLLEGLSFSFYHLIQFATLLATPYLLWRLAALVLSQLTRRAPPLKADAPWKRRFRDFESTRTVVVSCAALYAVAIGWFGFVHFSIAKLGLTDHYDLGPGCDAPPGLGDFVLHAFGASLGSREGCLSATSLLARMTDYLQIAISLFLLLVLVQALALAFSAQKPDQPPENVE